MAPPNPFNNSYGRNQGGGVGFHGTGGPTFKLRWNGDEVMEKTDTIFTEAMEGLRGEAIRVGRLFQQGHIQSGDIVNKMYAEVRHETGKRVTLALGSTSEHAMFEELGTRFRPAHPNMRRALDYMTPRILTAIKERMERGRE
jgi:hypothetical protein